MMGYVFVTILYICLMTLEHFFKLYPLTAKGIADRIGIRRELLSDYIRGKKKPSERRLKEIEDEIHKMGKEMSEIKLE